MTQHFFDRDKTFGIHGFFIRFYVLTVLAERSIRLLVLDVIHVISFFNV